MAQHCVVAPFFCLLIQLDEQQESGQAHFVPGTVEQWRNIGHAGLGAKFLYKRAGLRYTQAQKTVALAIFAGTGLEEAHQMCGLLFIGQGLHALYELSIYHMAKLRKIHEKKRIAPGRDDTPL